MKGEQLADCRRVAEAQQGVRHRQVLVDAGQAVAEGEQTEILPARGVMSGGETPGVEAGLVLRLDVTGNGNNLGPAS